MTPKEAKIINDLTSASVAQRDVVLWLAQALAMQPAIDPMKLRADFLLCADSLGQKKGVSPAHQEEVKMLEAFLSRGAQRRDPPLSLGPPPNIF